MTRLGLLAIAGLLLAPTAWALTEDEYNNKVKEINARYQETYESAAKEGEDIKDEGESCIVEGAFDADWEITKISFDVPEVTMKLRDMSFHILKTTFTTKTIAKTRVPKTYFENKNVGFGIRTKVPVIRWEIDEVKTKVPEFKWGETSIKTKIPEFTSKRIEWKFHILKIKKLKELNIPCKEEEERAEKLSASVQKAADSHQAEINTVTAQYMITQAEALTAQMSVAEKGFDDALAAMDTSIVDMRSNGIDPATVRVDYDGVSTTVLGAREMLVQQKAEALASMRASHQQMLDAVSSMTGANAA
jgi:hypothetical protein